jgi:hypothetical protein
MMHQKTQLPNFLHEASGNITGRHVEVIEHDRRVLRRVTLGHWREKKGERTPSTLPPPKSKGKKSREEVEILIYKGRANHNAN